MDDPLAVALKFGFLAVLYLFLFWMARSALKDLRRGSEPAYEDATGMHHATAGLSEVSEGAPRLRVANAAGLRAGSAYDLSGGAMLGRGDSADIRLEDTFASSAHARIFHRGGFMYVEDMGSTNGTFLGSRRVDGPTVVPPGVPVKIGTSVLELQG